MQGLENLALAAYRQLVVDLAGKVEEAVRGKQMGLGMEQEVGGEMREGQNVLAGDAESGDVCQRSARLCLAHCRLLPHPTGSISTLFLLTLSGGPRDLRWSD